MGMTIFGTCLIIMAVFALAQDDLPDHVKSEAMLCLFIGLLALASRVIEALLSLP